MLPHPIKIFVELFSKLPSIGPRQATRLAYYIASLGKGKTRELAEAVDGLSQLTTCPRCFRTHIGKEKLCSICSDPKRAKDIITIVEKETDLLSLEKTKKIPGWYLIIGELSKTGNLDPEQKLKIASLKSFIQKELGGPSTGSSTEAHSKSSGQAQAEEIILAINPTAYGDFGAAMLLKELKDSAKKITRLGRGIPTGGEIEFADEDTLSNAIERRN